jgi:polyisoprenoid-binding protein YceI
MLRRLLPFALAAVLATPAAAATWEIDTAHSSVGFVTKHLLISKVRGRFREWSGTVVLDDKDLAKSTVNVTIKAASIDTDNGQRDNHLKSADFFDVAKFPEITFKSTKVEKGTTPSTLKVTGDLTIHGVTKPVVLDVSGPSPEFKDPGGNPHVAFSATTKINRKDFGLNWNKAVEASPVAGEEVAIEIEIELKNKK